MKKFEKEAERLAQELAKAGVTLPTTDLLDSVAARTTRKTGKTCSAITGEVSDIG